MRLSIRILGSRWRSFAINAVRQHLESIEWCFVDCFVCARLDVPSKKAYEFGACWQRAGAYGLRGVDIRSKQSLSEWLNFFDLTGPGID